MNVRCASGVGDRLDGAEVILAGRASDKTAKALEMDGMIDLGDHTVTDILNNPSVADGFKVMLAGSSFFDAVKVLKEPKTRVVVAVNPDDGLPVGVVLRAHRRY